MIKNRFNLYSYFVFIFHGGFYAGSQVLVNTIAQAYNAGPVEKSRMVSAIYLGSMLMVLIAGEISERIGKRKSVALTSFFMGLGGIIIAFSANTLQATIGFFIYGSGIGGFESGLFSLVDDYNKDRAYRYLNNVQVMFSIGAVMFPLLVDHIDFNIFYICLFVFMICNGILFSVGKSIDSFAGKPAGEKDGISFLKLLKNPYLVSYMLIMFLYIGAEGGLLYWLVQYFEDIGAKDLGAKGVSAFWLLSILGRLIGGRVRNAKKFLPFCFVLGALGMTSVLIFPNPNLKLMGVGLLGLGLAPMYPGLLAFGGSLSEEYKTTAYSLMVFSAGLGGTSMQPVIGLISERYSISRVYTIIGILFIILSAMLYATISGSESHNKEEG